SLEITHPEAEPRGILLINGIAKVQNRMFLISNSWDNNTNQSTYVLYFSDNGSDWNIGDTLFTGNNYYEFIPSNNDSLYFIDNNNRMLHSSADGINIFDFPTTGLDLGTQLGDRKSISVDTSGSNLFYKCENNSTFYKFNFGAKTWEATMNGITPGAAGLAGIYSFGNTSFATAFYLGTNSSLSITLFSSSDGGANWSPVTNNGGLAYPIFDYGVYRIGNGRLIAADVYKNLYYSDNEGQNWTMVNTIMAGSYYNITQLNNGSLFALKSNCGIITSSDNGSTWTLKNGDLSAFQGNLFFTKQIAGKQSTMYLTNQQSPFEGKLDLYKSSNSGTNWTLVSTAPDSTNKTLLCFNGNYPLFSFQSDNGNGTYQFSTDGGTSWTDITSAINTAGINKVKGFCGDGDTLFVAGQNGSNNILLYWSTDGGANFAPIVNGLSNKTSLLIANEYSGGDLPNFPIMSFGAGGNNPILATRDDNNQSMYKFFKLNSTKDGWEAVSNNGINVPNGNLSPRFLKQQDGVWYFCTDLGVYASSDACATWKLVWDNQGFQSGMQNIAFLAKNNYIYVGTRGAGIWRAQVSAPSITTNAVSNTSSNSTTSGGSAVSDGGIALNTKGLCWGLNSNPTIADDTLDFGSVSIDFSGLIENLTSNTTYHVRAFAINPLGTTYGNDVQFTTDVNIGIKTADNSNMLVFPNPTNNQLYLLMNNTGSVEISFINTNGQVVLNTTQEGNAISLDVASLKAGVYMLQTKSNNKIETTRILITK
ncbi:MAG: T9SS type A sorting domain-containing protein, partial [Bacteroidota bacterium]